MDPNFKLFRLSQLIIEYLLVRTFPFLPLSFITLPPPLSLSHLLSSPSPSTLSSTSLNKDMH